MRLREKLAVASRCDVPSVPRVQLTRRKHGVSSFRQQSLKQTNVLRNKETTKQTHTQKQTNEQTKQQATKQATHRLVIVNTKVIFIYLFIYLIE